MAEVCDCCDGPVVWLLENRTDNWDFDRAYCAGRCESSMRRNPRGATNHQVACVQISFPVSRHVQPCSSSVIHTAAQHGQRPVLCCLPTSTVVPGCSRSVPGQAGQWPSASRLSRVLSHDVAAAHSRMNATSSAESLAA